MELRFASDRNEKYQVINNDIVENADVCIIGSGAAGAVLAKELVESGKNVVLIGERWIL